MKSWKLLILSVLFTACLGDDLECCVPIDSPGTDPFQIKTVEVVEENLEVEVSYAGGCKEHNFELIWPDAITMIFPPDFSVVLYHDANEDNCEALITDTLVFDINKSGLGLSPKEIEAMKITVVNASKPSEKVSNR